ncbi:2-hydroxyacid dehydrogenase [Streptomyces sp. NBC_00154]|uniref:2-hydroxyacid dehydrogenase n=1 Tax=Streptomyces sp. NBC_00154 TaxID=2975670 RepID=UPI00225AD39E|nr:2-hydroxyacid dehydrogenase [Streptomyces sp. NBC_00154]MCX5310016.1 2-hydroxyacid dehydrogenase [Streptomyces sp. NBC_00154]
MTDRKTVLAVVPPHVGGRQVGAVLAAAFADRADVTVVEAAGEDPEALSRARVLVTALAPVTGADIQAAPLLEFVQCSSHGFDYVDLDTARDRGVTVCNIGSTGAEHREVAEHTFALLLALAKQLVPAHTALAAGDWANHRLQRSLTGLAGKTLGLVGFGVVAQEVARRATAFDMTVLYTARSEHAEAAERYGARRVPLEELLRSSDAVSLHVPLTEETWQLLDADRLALLKPTAFLINTARGAVVDQEALADALEAGRIAGAGLDVFDPEPPGPELRLLRAPNVVLTPHIAGVTRGTVPRIVRAAMENTTAYLDGKPPRDVVCG